MSAWRRRLAATAGFALLALLTELTGRSIVVRLDRAFHVVPLATPTTLVLPVPARRRAGARRALAGRGSPGASSRRTSPPSPRSACSAASASGRAGLPRLRLRLSPRLWLLSFGATSTWYLLQNDAGPVAHGRWPLLAPWLHTYALRRLRRARRPARDRVGGDPRLARRRRGLRRRHLRARLPHPALPLRLRPRARPEGSRTTGRRAACSATSSSRGHHLSPPSPRREPCPRAVVSIDDRRRCGGITSCHSPIGGHGLQRFACPRGLAASARSPSWQASSGRSSSPTGSRSSIPYDQGFWWLVIEPPLLVAAAGVFFALVIARPLIADLESDRGAP